MKYDFHTLFLLIGTNPLPNFVVSQYFIDRTPTLREIVFIYSEKTEFQESTKKFAENLHKIIKERYNERDIKFEYVALSNISFANKILLDLDEHFKRKNYSNKIHLNYTGGTKVMCVHVHKFLEKIFSNSVSYSYLDPRTFSIIFDDGTATDDLRASVDISYDEILKLHGFMRKDNVDIKIKYEDVKDAVSEIRKIINSGELDRFLELNPANKFKDMKKNLNSFQAQQPLLRVLQSLPHEYQIFDSKTEKEINHAIKFLINFFEGKWFELYVYEVINEYLKNSIIKIEFDCKITKSEWHRELDFQLDLLLIKGYQLIGISCTTSKHKSTCKTKGFEIFFRTKQIGGQEAKSILITTMEKSDIFLLSQELKIETGGSQNILILGKEHIRDKILLEQTLEFIK